VRLGDVAKVIRGVNFKKTEILSSGKGVPVCTASHIRDDVLVKDDLIFVPPEKVKEDQKIQKEDIVIIMSTGSKVALGRTFFSRTNENIFIGAFLGIIRCFDMHPKFFYFFTKSSLFKRHILGYTGSQINNISISKLKKLKIPLLFRNNESDLEKQKEIASYLDNVYEKIKTLKEKIQNQINQLEDMKESILDEVFNHEN